MGDSQNQDLRVSFDSRLKLKFCGSQVTTDAGLLALPKPIQNWSLTTLREKLIKVGAKVTRHAKYVFFQLAEVAVPRRLFAAILDRIARLAIPPPVTHYVKRKYIK